MSEDVLDRNLRLLLQAAPERARLSPEAHRRIRAKLDTAWEGSPTAPARPTSHESVPPRRLRLLPTLVAAAAAILLLALGASRLLGDSSSPEAPAGGDAAMAQLGPSVQDPDDSDLDPSARVGDPRGSAGTATGMGGSDQTLASADGRGERVPAGGQPEGTGNDTAGSPDPSGTNADTPSEAGVVATIEMAAPGEESVLPAQLTLWVKPVVQLPQVADPVAFEVPLTFVALEANGRVAAQVALPTALARVHEVGSKNVLLQVEAPGMAPSRALVSTEEAAAGAVRFALEPGITLAGTVVDNEDGSPIQGALVVALDQLPLDSLAVGADPKIERLPQPYAITDALGRYTLTNVARKNIVRLRASGGDFAPTIEPVATDSSEPTQIALGKGTTVTGIVERPDGTRWSGAVVVVSQSGRDPSAQDRPAMTYGIDQCDTDGEFTIQGLPAGNYVALVFDPGDRETPVEFRQVRLRGSPSLRIDFLSANSTPEASSGLTLDGVLVDQDGNPLANESLSLSAVEGSLTPFSEWRVADSDEQGQFHFRGINASRYVIHRVLDGFERMAPVWEGRIEASRTLRIELADTSVHLTWRGAASEDRSWTILERWKTEQSRWDYAGSAPSSVGAEVRETQFDHLPPGRYRAVLMGPGHGATWSDPFEVEASRPVELTAPLKQGASLPIIVVNAATGEPVVGATVRVSDADGRRIPQREDLTTDLEGRATQLSVPFGRVTLQVVGPGETERVAREIDFIEAPTGAAGGAIEIQLPVR